MLKKIVRRSSLLIIASLLSLNVSLSSANAASKQWSDDNHLIAHGLGIYKNITVTNSLEAFQENYQKGYRVFEVDLILTSDNHLVARHDWEPYLYDYFQQIISPEKKGLPLTLAEFISLPIAGNGTPLTFENIVELLNQYPDIYFVTDTKYLDATSIRTQFEKIRDKTSEVNVELLDRVIPQLYTEGMYDRIHRIFPFKEYIYTLYQTSSSNQQILDFVKDKYIQTVVMSDTRFEEKFVNDLLDNGVRTFVHTINDENRASYYIDAEVYGLYTDTLLPEQMVEIIENKTPLTNKLTVFGTNSLFDTPGGVMTGTISGQQHFVYSQKQSNDWFEIQINGNTKWIKPNKFVEDFEVMLPTGRNYTATKTLNLYSSPFNDAKTIYKIAPQTVMVKAELGNWLRISSSLGDVWINPTEQETVSITKTTKLYRTNNINNPIGSGAQLAAPQTVNVIERKGEWYKISTWLGEAWISPSLQDYISLNQVTKLYNSTSLSSYADAYLQPQLVKPIESLGDWHKINTWIGQKWIYTGSTQPEPYQLNKRVQLYKEASLQKPYPDAFLSPQTVYVVEKKTGWFKIKTWLGELWIQVN